MHRDMTRVETDTRCQAYHLTSSSAALPVKCGRRVKPWPIPLYRSTRVGKGFFAMACANTAQRRVRTHSRVYAVLELVVVFVT